MRAGLFVALALTLAACASRPEGNLIAVEARAPGASQVDMLVATTRAPAAQPGVMFSGERARGLHFADITVSIPPDAVRKIGDIQWPASPPGDPAHDFVTLRAERLELQQAREVFNKRIAASPGRHALVFVHGYNTRFEEAVYRFAQIAHDAGATVVPVLFTWPSRGKIFDYRLRPRERRPIRATRSRRCCRRWSKTPKSARSPSSPIRWAISSPSKRCGRWRSAIVGVAEDQRHHARLARYRLRRVPPPDRRNRGSDKSPPVTLFVSQDDKALGLSILAGDDPASARSIRQPSPTAACSKRRMSTLSISPASSPTMRQIIESASAGVVSAIGARLAEGQALGDGDFSIVKFGAAGTVARSGTH